MARESFGIIDTLPSGNIRARYTAPDGKRYSAPATFRTRGAARHWLAERKVEIASGKWVHPDVAAAKQAERSVTLGEYAGKWVATRTNSKGERLRTRTREEYERMLRSPGEKEFDSKGGPLADLLSLTVSAITPATVRQWRAGQLATGKATQTSRAYGLLNSIMATAVQDGVADMNPCQIKGGQSTNTGKRVIPPTDEELEVILTTIKPEYRALVIVAAIGGLRFGEATELRAKNVKVERGEGGAVSAVRLTIAEAVVKTSAGRIVGGTKSTAGIRTLAIFGKDAEIIAEHMRDKIGDALLFPSADGVRHLGQSTFWRHWHKAVVAAGRDDLPFHGLRHYAGTRYAQVGATVKETMARLGHSSEKAAMRYQHSGNRDDELAARMGRRTTA